jgi:hypothetical protein
MKRRFQHYVILVITKTVLIGLSSLFVFGWISVVYHLMFNSPTITFGGW